MKVLLIVFVGIALVGTLFVIQNISMPSVSETATDTGNQNVSAPSVTANYTPTSAIPTTIKAGFAIYTNGVFRIFTAPMYHNLSPDVYIESANPNIVVVKQENTTWYDFFSTLPFSLDDKCLTTGTGEQFCSGNGGTLRFYINGTERKDALNSIIKNGDRLLVTFGSEAESERETQIDSVPSQ